MLQEIVIYCVLALVYFCLLIVIFSPSIYAIWLYIVSRRVKIRRAGALKIAVTTFCINALLAYFVIHLAFDYFLTTKVAEKDALAGQTLRNAVVSQKKFFQSYGRYYSVGPVRGPYQDGQGLTVEKDVILFIEPHWDKARGREAFNAYALHVWGKSLLTSSEDGKVRAAPDESDYFDRLRKKMILSVK